MCHETNHLLIALVLFAALLFAGCGSSLPPAWQFRRARKPGPDGSKTLHL